MDQYITVQDASNIININAQGIIKLVQSGTIRAITHNGVKLVSQADVLARLPVPDRPEFNKNLLGKKIMISDLAAKHGLSHVTVMRWVKRGYIPVLDRGPGRSVWIDEAYGTYCATVYKAAGGQGKWMFNEDGTPYIKR